MPPPPLRPLSLGEVLDVSFGLYRARFVPLLLIAVVCRLFPILLAVYFEVADPAFSLLWLRLLTGLISLVLIAIAVAASTFIVADAYLGRETSAVQALSRATPLIGNLIGISILTSLLVFLGLVLLIVPGLICLAGLMLSPVVAVIEGPPRSRDAMQRSWQLARGFKGKILLTMLVAFLLLVVPTMVLGAVGGLVGAVTGEPVALLLFVISLVMQVFVYPFVYVVQTVLYYDLRVRKEGFDLEVLASAMPAV
jgi:MFS family permease